MNLAHWARTWFNELGNREMYMNCAVVTISGGKRRRRSFEDDASDFGNGTTNDLAPRAGLSGPTIFIANIGNGCTTVDSRDVVFPSPGSVVQYGSNAGNRNDPSGTCDGQSFTGGSVSGGSSSNSESSSSPGGPSPTGHQGDCTYWASQGYLCSGSSSGGTINPLSFSLTLLVGLGFMA
jgi:hypothetical protein